MSRKRRALILTMFTGTGTIAVLPKNWSRPLIKAVVMPAHAQTSASTECSGFEVEPIDRSIDIVVDSAEIRGPIIAPLTPAGTFNDTQTIVMGSCSNGAVFSQETTFSGSVNSASNEVTGDLLIRQFCGSSLFCEQISVFSATQIPLDASSDLGTYQGRITGSQSCCQDFF